MAAAIAFAAAGGLGAGALAQVRVAEWNVTNWSSSPSAVRVAAFKTAFYGAVPATTGSPPLNLIAAGQSMAPDIVIVQEVEQGGAPSAVPWPSADRDAKTVAGQASVNSFLNLLNTALGSPGDWAAAPYVANQGDDGNALFYRSTKFAVLAPTVTLGVLGTDVCGNGNCGVQTNQSPRDNQRWRLRLVGYDGVSPEAELYIYSAHMKAGDTGADQTRRIPEAARIRNDAQTLPAGANFLLGGDFNIQSSNQTAYELLTDLPALGRFFDPINRPGSWNNNCDLRNIHTQEPTSSGTGGMDDRHDQVLVSGGLRDGQGMSYIPHAPGGNILTPFISAAAGCPASTTATAWFDANHSYRCWGNDGNHYNDGIIAGSFNTQVGSSIALALIESCNGNGHLPVYLDLQVPAKLGAPTGTIDLGSVAQGSAANYTLNIANLADVARFSKDASGWGIDPLTYALAISGAGFALTGGAGPFERPAVLPAASNEHTITIDTSTTGPRSGTLSITTDDPDSPLREVTLIATVVPPTGACCTQGVCTTTTQPGCTGSYQGHASACTPTLCPQPSGACCSGTACSIATPPTCVGVFQGPSTLCGTPVNPTTCCPANFNGIDGVEVADIFAFLAVWFNAGPAADFDHSGTVTVSDIFAFLTAWFARC